SRMRWVMAFLAARSFEMRSSAAFLKSDARSRGAIGAFPRCAPATMPHAATKTTPPASFRMCPPARFSLSETVALSAGDTGDEVDFAIRPQILIAWVLKDFAIDREG